MSALRLALRLNALSCVGFGGLFVGAPAQTAEFLGSPPVAVIIGLGGALLFNGGHLVLASTRRRLAAAEVMWFSEGDLLWWLGTLALVACGQWITTSAGVVAALLVAAGVAALGVAQLFLLGQRKTGLGAAEHWRRLGQSWLGLPLPVKLWLLLLNAVFLASLGFWPTDISRFTLAAYVASGPLLLGIAAAQGGLTRLLGLAHLLAWLPLLIWLIPRLGTATLEAGFALLLFAVTLICLALDLWDIRRWLGGDRAVLGLATLCPGAARQAIEPVDVARPFG